MDLETTQCAVGHSCSGRPSHINARILYLINSLGGGGAERSLAELLPYYEKAGIEPVVLCLRRRKEGVEEEVRKGSIDLRYCRKAGWISWTLQLRRLLSSERFDLLHTTIFESDIVGRLAAAGSGVPVLTSLVNTSYDPIRLTDPRVNRLGLWCARMLDGWTARALTTHFHAITHAVKSASVQALRIAPETITVIERGRDPNRLGSMTAERRTRCRRALQIEEDEEVLVNVGRQEFQKGQAWLLEAFSRVADVRPRARLLIVGRRGNASLELEELQRELGLGERIRFLGHRDDVPDILAAADAFVFPSLYEGQGGALIEAMALGLPIVASDIPSTREVVESDRNAFLVKAESPAGLAEAIVRLLDEPDRMQLLGQRSLEIFRARFTLENSASRMIDLYRHLIGGMPVPTPQSMIR